MENISFINPYLIFIGIISRCISLLQYDSIFNIHYRERLLFYIMIKALRLKIISLVRHDEGFESTCN